MSSLEAIRNARYDLERGAHGRITDFEVAMALGHKGIPGRASRFTGDFTAQVLYRHGPYQGMTEPVPPWTDDLQAAIIAVHHHLPGWKYEISGGFKVPGYVCLFDPVRREITEIMQAAVQGNLAQALITAMMTAFSEELELMTWAPA